jgi:hypothetical protein
LSALKLSNFSRFQQQNRPEVVLLSHLTENFEIRAFQYVAMFVVNVDETLWVFEPNFANIIYSNIEYSEKMNFFVEARDYHSQFLTFSINCQNSF